MGLAGSAARAAIGLDWHRSILARPSPRLVDMILVQSTQTVSETHPGKSV